MSSGAEQCKWNTKANRRVLALLVSTLLCQEEDYATACISNL